MREFVYHIGEGQDDYHAAVSIWPKRFGNTCGGTIATAMRSGGLILTRDKSDDQVVGATILDFSTYKRALFVPLVWVRDNEDKKARALVLRDQLELIIKALILSGRDRLMAMRDESEDNKRTVKEFNKLARSNRVPVRIEVMGTVHDLFGDGRTVAVTSLFIQSPDRPDLVSNVLSISKTTIDSAFRSVRGLGAAAEFCSGCKEGKEVDKDPGKGEKGEKDGKEIESIVTSTKLNLEVEAMSLFAVYNQLGIRRFNRYNKPSHFVPLV